MEIFRSFSLVTLLLIVLIGNLIDIFKFVKPSYSLPESTLSPFSNLINELDRPLDRYLGTCPKYELCRAAMILKQKDEISVLQIEQLWVDLNSKNERQKMTLVNPISASGSCFHCVLIGQWFQSSDWRHLVVINLKT